MDIKTLFGLPAHPLLVHVPVVLIPLAFIGACGMFWAPWRARFGGATAVILVVAGIFTQLAIGSGQALRRSLEETALMKAHVRIAEDIRPWLLLFFIALVTFLWLERRHRAAATGPVSLRRPLLAGPLVAAIVFGAISVYWIQRIGHTGAKAVWQPKMDQARRQDVSGDQRGGGGDSR
jgi:uncharacterized membrane protein